MSADQPGWMIYGAYGYSGELIAREAVRREHRPVLAGRSAKKLQRLADELGLEHRVFELSDSEAVARELSGVDLVLHAAGPFIHTAAPMRLACLRSGTNYLDITGEIPVFLETMEQDAEARRRSVALIPGVGFDVVPTDCLARYVSNQVRDADELHIAIKALTNVSQGTAKTALWMMQEGGLVRRNGELVLVPLASQTREVTFPGGKVAAMAAPLPDVVTAYHSTRIPNITTYLVQSRLAIRLAKMFGPLAELLEFRLVRAAAEGLISLTVRGPDAEQRERGRTLIWACAARDDGRYHEAWLDTLETYRFTAVASVRAAERVLAERPIGALTPSQAFGVDFVLEMDGTRRYDALP